MGHGRTPSSVVSAAAPTATAALCSHRHALLPAGGVRHAPEQLMQLPQVVDRIDSGSRRLVRRAESALSQQQYHLPCLLNAPLLEPLLEPLLAPTAQARSQQKIGGFHSNLFFNEAGDQVTVSMNWESVANEDSTITLDPKDHRIFLPTAQFQPPQPSSRPKPIDGTQRILVYGP